MKFVPRRWALVSLAFSVSGLAACDDNGTEPEVLNQVQNVAVTPISPTSLQITFDAVTGAQSYEIQRAQGLSGGTFATVQTVTTTTHTDQGLDPNTEYSYRVTAVDGSDRGPYGQASGRTQAIAGLPIAEITSDITSDRTFYSDSIYRLGTFIKVQNGATLSIQPGTRIEGEELSALFILRGAKIMAEGNADEPIVFTSAKPEGQRKAGDWGGLIIIGNGIINRTGTVILEGTGTSGTNPQQDYAGGTDNSDDSGSLSYVRVEFAGFGPATDQELNSFTFAGVGSGTEMEYLQSLYGLDDSFEWFGGAVNSKYLVSYESGDDHFDASEGYVGSNQFVIAYQSIIPQVNAGAGAPSNDPQGIENDGCGDSSGGTCAQGQNTEPFNTPMFANYTLIGTGPGAGIAAGGGFGMVLRRGTGGYYVNGVVARWPNAAISLRDTTSTRLRHQAGELVLSNLLLADNGAAFQTSGNTFTVDAVANAIETVNATTASLFAGFPAAGAVPTAAAFDWTPAGGSPAATGGTGAFTGTLATKAGDFVAGTNYRGAADPNGAKWWQDWTNYARD